MNFFRYLLQILNLLFFVSCATNYKGPTTKFTGTKKERNVEYKKFKFDDRYWGQYRDAFVMGEEGSIYFTDSLKSVIEKVEPAMMISEFKKADYTHYTGLVLLGAAIAMLFIEGNPGDWSSGKKATYYSLLGASVASTSLSVHFMSRAASKYNRELKKKLSIGLATTYKY